MPSNQSEIIGSLCNHDWAPRSSAALTSAIESISRSETKIIDLTITEKGYCMDIDGSLDFSNPDGIYSDGEEEEDDFDASEVTGGREGPNREARLQDVQFDAFLEHDYQDDTIGDLEDKITIEGLAEQMNGVTLEPGTYFEDIIDNYLENDGNQEYDDGNPRSKSNERPSQDKAAAVRGTDCWETQN